MHVHETKPAVPVGEELFREIFDHLRLQELPEHDRRALQTCQRLSDRIVDVQNDRALGEIAKPAIRAKMRNRCGQLRRDFQQPDARQVEKRGFEMNLARTSLVRTGWGQTPVKLEPAITNGVLIVIESPLMTYGFVVLYDRQRPVKKGKLADRRDSTYGLKVMPISVVRIDDRYLAQRNIPKSKTFAGKNLAVVGCGTIGGYLSDMLVKAGAGTCGGKLTLVDFDALFPQNIGRHRLGFPDLLSNKAEAMAKELKRLAPGAEIRALPVDVRQAQLGALDLLIDATGEESLGHWLCGHYPPPTPMLSVWIEGPGTAVRALLRTNASGACYRCLWHSNKRGELRSTRDPLPAILAGHGCEGLYVPFPASVSVHAASLGAETALDWVNGVYSPALRTRLIDHAHQLATPDCDPLPDRECPLCNS